MSEFITITIEQLDNMKHAIGYKRDKVKHGKYEAYRNYFTASTTDESWQQLVEKGYALCTKGEKAMIYNLSEKGFELLEVLLDIKISRR